MVLAQDLSLKPLKTKLISQHSQPQEGVIISQKIYKSDASKKQIIKFYRRLLTNQGFVEDKGNPPVKDSRKNLFFFGQQDQGLIVVLNYTGLNSQASSTYSIITHNFSLK